MKGNPRRSFFFFLLILAGIAGATWLYAFCQMPVKDSPLAIDWKVLWRDTFHAQIVYGRPGGLFLPPWGLPLLIPLTFLPLCFGWGVMGLWALGGMFAWVPPPSSWRKHLPSLVLLFSSFPLLRQLADGNIEGMVLTGLWLSWFGARRKRPLWVGIGFLLASLKPQVSGLLLLYTFLQMLRSWESKRLYRTAVPLVIWIGATMAWQGKAWLEALFPSGSISSQMGKGMLWDMSWWATSSRWGFTFPQQLLGALLLLLMGGIFWYKIGRSNPWANGMALTLVGVNLLLSPYAAANSFLDVLAIGYATLYAADVPLLAWLAVLIADLPLFLPLSWRYAYGSNWYTGEILGMLGILWLLTFLWKERLS